MLGAGTRENSFVAQAGEEVERKRKRLQGKKRPKISDGTDERKEDVQCV